MFTLTAVQVFVLQLLNVFSLENPINVTTVSMGVILVGCAVIVLVPNRRAFEEEHIALDDLEPSHDSDLNSAMLLRAFNERIEQSVELVRRQVQEGVLVPLTLNPLMNKKYDISSKIVKRHNRLTIGVNSKSGRFKPLADIDVDLDDNTLKVVYRTRDRSVKRAISIHKFMKKEYEIGGKIDYRTCADRMYYFVYPRISSSLLTAHLVDEQLNPADVYQAIQLMKTA